ncbi:unnamed protein product [Mycetohabitans rhizoxinica HKI 454]|uniref:Uncharacterized protein n=1 Tax=Mycetohabitans rhizoxinica (strain DSM 19002 / CIP 109453 / HKI 454) TaxID=882378 RepID=E5AQS5_MYCRK|nr:unnamed protein product [Mycetohabitans rhizoxinica HKI 454]
MRQTDFITCPAETLQTRDFDEDPELPERYIHLLNS